MDNSLKLCLIIIAIVGVIYLLTNKNENFCNSKNDFCGINSGDCCPGLTCKYGRCREEDYKLPSSILEKSCSTSYCVKSEECCNNMKCIEGKCRKTSNIEIGNECADNREYCGAKHENIPCCSGLKCNTNGRCEPEDKDQQEFYNAITYNPYIYDISYNEPATKKLIGEGCEKNIDCVSNVCKNKKCVRFTDFSNDSYYNIYDISFNKPSIKKFIGAECEENIDCVSNTCKDKKCVNFTGFLNDNNNYYNKSSSLIQLNEPKPTLSKKNSYEYCLTNEECKSGECASYIDTSSLISFGNIIHQCT